MKKILNSTMRMSHDMNKIHTKKKDSIATESLLSKPCRNINLRQSWKHNCFFQADEDGERFEQAGKLAFKVNIIMILIKMIMPGSLPSRTRAASALSGIFLRKPLFTF